jgi:hypothetical protein
MVNQHENVWGDISGSGLGALRRIVNEKAHIDWSKVFWGNDSSPYAYPYNLNLLLYYLEQGDLMDQAHLLLSGNAQQFISRFLS